LALSTENPVFGADGDIEILTLLAILHLEIAKKTVKTFLLPAEPQS